MYRAHDSRVVSKAGGAAPPPAKSIRARAQNHRPKEAVTKCYDHTDTGSFSSINLSNQKETRSIAWHREHFFLKSIQFSDKDDNYFCEIASIGKKFDHPIDLHEVKFFRTNEAI